MVDEPDPLVEFLIEAAAARALPFLQECLADADARFGQGFTERVRRALLALDEDNSEVLDLFSTGSFVATDNRNYMAIRDVAESLGILRR